MEFEFQPDWALLESLRDRFLSEKFPQKSSYWNNEEALNQYHHTFAQRIGWKWDAVLKEVQDAVSTASQFPKTLFDWGCGTGIASLKIIEQFGRLGIKEVILWDRSHSAVEFSMKSIQKRFPHLQVRAWDGKKKLDNFTMISSHVLNEWSFEAEQEFRSLLALSTWIFWVEPGTPTHSKKMIEVRESLLPTFTVISPCPHQSRCGLLDSSREKDWCHFFASPPHSVFQNSFWTKFSQQLRIDLRSLPTSFLVLAKSSMPSTLHHSSLFQERVLGRMRSYKGYSLALTCSKEGVHEKKLLRRTSSQVINDINNNPFSAWIK